MKNILVPTDFTVDSLILLRDALDKEGDDKVNVVLTYGKELPSSISELVFFSKSKLLATLESENFKEAKAILENKYSSRINIIRTDIFFGKNQSAFENFVKGNHIDKAYIPKDENSLQPRLKKGFDLIPFIKKSGLELTAIEYNHRPSVAMEENLAKLLVP